MYIIYSTFNKPVEGEWLTCVPPINIKVVGVLGEYRRVGRETCASNMMLPAVLISPINSLLLSSNICGLKCNSLDLTTFPSIVALNIFPTRFIPVSF